MNSSILSYLANLMNAPSPSGYEDQARAVWRAEMATVADRVYGDTHGNSIAVLNEKGSLRVMLAGHIDELGFQITFINDEGYLGFKAIGGFDAPIVPGRRVTIHTVNGPVKGVIGKKAIHLMKADERGKATELTDLWIDIGLDSKKKTEKLVEIGDCATLTDGFDQLSKTVYVSRGVDDRIGAFVAGEVLRYLKGRQCAAAVYAVATVQEEIGLRGARTSAYAVDPQVAFAIDVAHAVSPDTNKKLICGIELGKGPTVGRGANFNPKLYRLVMDVAKKKKLKVQIEPATGGTGTDANAIQLNRAGVPCSLIGIPNRYMHTPVELFDIRDVETAVTLIGETILAMNTKTDFVI